MSIFNPMIQGEFDTSSACEALPQAGNRSHFSVMTLGGCNLHYTGELLSKFGSTRHYWRHNFISDMEGPIPLQTVDVGDDAANRTIGRYVKKYHLEKIHTAQADAFVFECASDFAFSYLKVGEGFMPDIRSDLFSEGWSEISFEHIPLLAQAQKISADDPIYWTMWLSAFSAYYDRILKDKIAKGKKIFFIRRLLAPHTFSPEGRVWIKDPDIFFRNGMLRRVYRQIEKFSGITFIDPPESLLFSSVSAPSGGPWEMHPDEEYYTFVVEKLLEKLEADTSVAARFRWDRVAASAMARATAEMRVSLLEEELAEQSIKLDELVQKRDHALISLEGAVKKIADLGDWAHNLHTQRDHLFEENTVLLGKVEAVGQKNGELGNWAHDLNLQRDHLFEENKVLLEKVQAAERECAIWKSKSEIYEQSKWWHRLFMRSPC